MSNNFLKLMPEKTKVGFTMKQIVVLAGKGGVGKSTVAKNLAYSLKNLGFKVGLLDADVHGPNIPQICGVPMDRKLEIFLNQFDSEGDGTGWDYIKPINMDGVKLMSLGFTIPDEAPVLWAGDMKKDAVLQTYRLVDWGDIDYLIVDAPSGTGDELHAILEQKPIGGIIVTTPHAASVSDAKRAITALREFKVPLLGIINNMAIFICQDCGKEHYLTKEVEWDRNLIIAQYPFDFDYQNENQLPEFDYVALEILKRTEKAKVVKLISTKRRLKRKVLKFVLRRIG